MAEALTMPWRAGVSKMIIIIADAPPHGIGEAGDGFPGGTPDGEPRHLKIRPRQTLNAFFSRQRPA